MSVKQTHSPTRLRRGNVQGYFLGFRALMTAIFMGNPAVCVSFPLFSRGRIALLRYLVP